EKFLEGEMGVDAGGDDAGGDFFTGFENDAGGAAILDENFIYGGLRADFHAELAGRGGDSIADGAGATATEAPGAEGAVDLAHVMVQENVSGAGRANTEE